MYAVSYANWQFYYDIGTSGEGLVIWFAHFDTKLVLWRASQPFALVPYHTNHPTYKDGLGPQCGGQPYSMIRKDAPNVGNQAPGPPPAAATVPDAVQVTRLPATPIEPAVAEVWAKFQVGNYQYSHRWRFSADGSIRAEVGLGGHLYYHDPGRPHIHNFYFRFDFDIVTPTPNVVERFAHRDMSHRDTDVWSLIPREQKQVRTPQEFTTWRVRNKRPDGDRYRAYELIPCTTGYPDNVYSSADAWVVRYKPGFAELGEDVADPPTRRIGCTDEVLESRYVQGGGGPESVDGEDVVVWYCLRTHHFPRQNSEEHLVLPYEFLGVDVAPRDFLDDTPRRLYATVPPSP